MKRKILAAAVAGTFAAPFAMAQTNVTIYGVADVTFENAKADGATNSASGAGTDRPSRNRVSSNSSLLGFRGSEDLGNGLKAIFQFETQVGIDGTTGGLTSGSPPSPASPAGFFTSQRDTFVGLTGGFGTVKLGFVSGPYRNLAAGLDLTPGATGLSTTLNFIGFAQTASGGTAAAPTVSYLNLAGRINNAVEYTTPDFAGLTATILYSANEGKSNENLPAGTPAIDPKIWVAGLNYALGPLKAGYAYQRRDDQGTFFGAADARGEIKSHLAGLSYTFLAGTTANLEYEDTRVEVDNPGAGLISKSKTRKWGVGIGHSMGPHHIVAAYVRADDGSVSTNGAAGVRQNADGREANFWTARYAYNFSKRTHVYAVYSKITNKSNAAFDYLLNPIGPAAGADPQAYGVGMRHTF